MLRKPHLLFVGLLFFLTGCPLCAPDLPVWTPPPGSGSRDKPFNVVWKYGDLNGLPLNPDWGTQVPQSAQLPPPSTPPECVLDPYLKPACTDQDTVIDKAALPSSLICGFILESHIHGHVNWMPAEYVGGLAWWNFAEDWDYNFAIVPYDYAGLTNFNNTVNPSGKPQKFIEAEFDSRETAERFVTPWWTKFRETAAGLDSDATQAFLAGSKDRMPQAVVVGLFGLDCEHDCRSEIHPVYGLAVEVSDRADDNVWVMFVRNWGNEGFCSQDDHQMNFSDGKITMMLPRISKGTATVTSNEFAVTDGSGIAFPAIEQVTGEGTKVTFTLPPPEKHALAELELHLKWQGDTYSPPKWTPKIKDFKRFATAMKPYSKRALGVQVKEDKVEDYLHDLYPLSVQRRQGPLLAVPPTLKLQAPPSKVRAQFTQAGPLEQRTHRSLDQERTMPAVTVKLDEDKIKRDCELVRAICSKYKNAPPADRIDFPKLCSDLSQQDACANAAHDARMEFERSRVR